MEKSDIKLLIVAVELKELQVMRFQELAVRFEPFDQNMSQFFNKKSLWDDKLKKKFTSFHEEYTKHAEMNLSSHNYRWHFENRFYNEDHFFMINHQMAYTVLLKTMTAEMERLHFYKQAMIEAKDPKLKSLFKICNELTFELCQQISVLIHKYKEMGRTLKKSLHSIVLKNGFFNFAFLQEIQ